jgi:hypothetical protein
MTISKLYQIPSIINLLVDDQSKNELLPINDNGNKNPKTKYQPIDKLTCSDYKL